MERISIILTVGPSKNQISLDFLKLPSKKLYPDYYESIKEPISLSEISAKVKSNQYETTQEFLDDFRLMANNANDYNEPESFIAKNSSTIFTFVEDQVNQFNLESENHVKSDQTPKLPKIKLRAPATTPSTPSTPTSTGSHKKQFLEILQELIDFEVDGIRIGDPFLVEVSRKDFPDYYKMIKHPMSLSTVKKHVNGNKLKTISQFSEEVDLIWQNAQIYNEESSLIYQDSKTLHDYFHNKIQELEQDSKVSTPADSTPTSKKKLALKVKPKPSRSKLKIHLNLKKDEEQEDENKEEEDEKEEKHVEEQPEDIEPSKTEPHPDTDSQDESVKKEETENSLDGSDPTATKAETKIEGQDHLESIKSTRKRSSKQTAADALIQEISISSSRSVYKQQVKNQNNSPLPTIFQNWFEYRFEANDFQVQSYTLSLPPQQGAVSVLAALNDSLVDRKHQANLTVNGERVSPIPSIQYADSGRRLTSRYELKLAMGLNMVVFDVAVDPLFNEESRLRSQDSEPNVEKLIFWVQVIQ